MSASRILRFVTHRIIKHPDTDVTFEAECLKCDWTIVVGDDGEAADNATMAHKGRTGHQGFRRIVTSFAWVEPVE